MPCADKLGPPVPGLPVPGRIAAVFIFRSVMTDALPFDCIYKGSHAKTVGKYRGPQK